jgi:hypothetical protein
MRKLLTLKNILKMQNIISVIFENILESVKIFLNLMRRFSIPWRIFSTCGIVYPSPWKTFSKA